MSIYGTCSRMRRGVAERGKVSVNYSDVLASSHPRATLQVHRGHLRRKLSVDRPKEGHCLARCLASVTGAPAQTGFAACISAQRHERIGGQKIHSDRYGDSCNDEGEATSTPLQAVVDTVTECKLFRRNEPAHSRPNARRVTGWHLSHRCGRHKRCALYAPPIKNAGRASTSCEMAYRTYSGIARRSLSASQPRTTRYITHRPASATMTKKGMPMMVMNIR